MSKPWAKIGAWAEEAEQAEAEEKEKAAAAASAASQNSQSFPSLKEAVNAKNKKKTKMTLQEFNTSSAFIPGGAARRGSALESRGLTPEEMLRLPTRPKERSAEEMQYGGRGFSSYGGGRSSAPPMRDSGRSYGGGGFDDDRRGGGPVSRVSEFDQSSRADEVDNWAMTKKTMSPNPSFDGGARSNRYASLGAGGNGGFSRADEVDNWAAGKKQQQQMSSSPFSRPSNLGFGTGFRDSSSSAGSGQERWTRGGRGLSSYDDQERPRLVLDKPKNDGGVVNESNVGKVKSNKANPFGAARPREEILAEKGLDWKKVDLEIEAKSSRPTSSHSSRPGGAQSGRLEGAVALQQGAGRPKVNLFGDAKPREVLLQEKGVDWRKIDLDYEARRVDRPETEEEKNLKEEIEQLKMGLGKESSSNADGEPLQVSSEYQISLHDIVLRKERDLEQLTRELDDKLWFGQKPMERPGSGSGRIATFPGRQPSQSGSFEESRRLEYMERPRSRDTGVAWASQGDDRRGHQGGRGRGLLGNRDLDRSRSKW